MFKRSSSKVIKTSMPAVIAGLLLVLSSAPAWALLAEPVAVQNSSSQPLMHGIRHAQSNSSSSQSNRNNRGRQYQNSSEQQRALRSRSEIVREVKQRHSGAEVLKVSLNRSRTSYTVRVLMPSGKVRSLQVSALR